MSTMKAHDIVHLVRESMNISIDRADEAVSAEMVKRNIPLDANMHHATAHAIKRVVLTEFGISSKDGYRDLTGSPLSRSLGRIIDDAQRAARTR